jgi:hypothetical protein
MAKQHEPKEEKDLAMPTDDFLYHYTSAQALLKIVTERKLWASEIEFLNDGLEGKVLLRQLKGMIEDPHCQISDLHKSAFRNRLSREQVTYVASFSKNPSMLTQFRMYCPPAGGYVIGFPKSFLSSHGRLIDVDYRHEQHHSWCHDYLQRYLNAAKEVERPGMTSTELDMAITNCGKFCDDHLHMRVRCKSPEFSTEEEARLVLTQGSSPLVRVSKNAHLLIPYIEINLRNDPIPVRIASGPSRNPELVGLSQGALHAPMRKFGTNWDLHYFGNGEFGFREL